MAPGNGSGGVCSPIYLLLLCTRYTAVHWAVSFISGLLSALMNDEEVTSYILYPVQVLSSPVIPSLRSGDLLCIRNSVEALVI